jgi:hypothetical protein
VPYWQVRGRRPFERASKIAHAEIINNPVVQEFIAGCTLPTPPDPASLSALIVEVPHEATDIKTIVAIDGGLTETWVRDEYPSASIAFITMGPLLLSLADLDQLDAEPFIGPEDMARLKNIQRYSLALPTRSVRAKDASSFSHGVRKSVQDFLAERDGELLEALKWLLFRGWRVPQERESWVVPRCPNDQSCQGGPFSFSHLTPPNVDCASCGKPVYVSDGLRLYERIDEETGAGGILAYALTALEHIVLVHVIKSIWGLKPTLLKQVLFVKDGPLAFFGVTAPLYKPMRDLMNFLGTQKGGPLINLVGLEKTGPFVEHAALVEDRFKPNSALVLTSSYVYKHIQPGEQDKEFGKNTYYGGKVIFRGGANDTYVATVPTLEYESAPTLESLLNGAAVLRTTARLRCSMYDNALIPVVLANRLVSLADVPSSEILAKFAKETMSA